MTNIELNKTGIAQAEFVQPPRLRHHKLKLGDGNKDLGVTRQSRVVGYLDEQTGDMGFVPVGRAKNIVPSELPHLTRATGSRVDLACQKPSLATALKQQTTSGSVNINQVWTNRGGNPNYRPPKTKGFFFKSTPAELMRERKRKINQARKATYQSHP